MIRKQYDHLPHAPLTGNILNCCFEVMNELGCGFLESVYKNALLLAIQQRGLADLVVEETVVVELKCCKSLLPEQQAQTINYLAAAKLPVGLLVNFGHRDLEYKRVHCPFYPAAEGDPASAADPVFLTCSSNVPYLIENEGNSLE